VKVDYIIVGLGLAGLAFAEELFAANKTFIVFEDNSQTSSLVAGGVYNPVILKRYTPVWNAAKQLEIALPFYQKLEEKLNIKFDEKFVIKKVFSSIEDQNNWFSATDHPLLTAYLDTEIDHQKKEGIFANFGFGNVKEAGKINTKKLVDTYRTYLKNEKKIKFEKFEHQQIKFKKHHLEYKEITANRIVFCEV
jgi:thioredoxin reductase